MPKKIALLFTGRIYQEQNRYHHIMQNLVDIQNKDYEIDIFISHPKDVNDELLQNVIELYKPVLIIRNNEIYDVKRIEKYATTPNINKHNIMSMWLSRYNLYNAFNEYVQEHNKQYDIIVHLRMDNIFREKFDLCTLQSYIDNNELCIPNYYDQYEFGGICDQIVVGNKETFGIWMKMFEKIYDILELTQFHPETMLMNYLRKYNTYAIHRFHMNYIWGNLSEQISC
uniref:Glycosyltransferase n=1 Tax=viral metagenome TaxID=1070528 RepID=A0A6C0HV90_9ZZZZ